MPYTVNVDVMDVVDKDAGEYPDGRPKKVDELHKGDEFDPSRVDEARLQVLIDNGAIVETKEEKPAAEKASSETTKKSAG